MLSERLCNRAMVGCMVALMERIEADFEKLSTIYKKQLTSMEG
jgi:hypothetical protein